MSEVLVVGEALVDVVLSGGRRTVHPGGSPLNVAVGLARLGVEVELLTRIGDDDNGSVVRRHLRDNAVPLADGSLVDAPTAVAEASLGTDGSASYRFDIEWDLPARPLPSALRALHAGSISAFLEPGASKVRRLLAAASRAGAVTTFDPNIRPALVGDRAIGRAATEAIARLVDVVKLSDEDARWLYPDATADDVLARLRALGPRVAVMTKGAGGAVLASAVGSVAVPAARVEVIDTIGAGDAYMSSLIAALVAGFPTDLAALEALGRRCATAAAITVSRAGAQPPTGQDVAVALAAIGR